MSIDADGTPGCGDVAASVCKFNWVSPVAQ